jgi:hypothetical protein
VNLRSRPKETKYEPERKEIKERERGVVVDKNNHKGGN